MNSHIGLQARVHDYEERTNQIEQLVLRSIDTNEEHCELDTAEASAEAELEVEVVEGVDEEDEPTHHDTDTRTNINKLGEGETLARSKSAVTLTSSDSEGEKIRGTTPSTEWVRYLDDV